MHYVLIYFWNKSVETDALFADMIESFDSTVELSNKRKVKKHRRRIQAAHDANSGQTEDVEMVEKENAEETMWGKKNWQSSGHILKRRVMVSFQHCMIDIKAIKTQHAILKALSEEMKKVRFISHGTYSSWIKDNRKSSNPIDGDSCEVMDRFASLVDQNDFDQLRTVLPCKDG